VSYQPFLVADLKEGLKRNIGPWLLPEKAYPNMTNMFTYDGVINKKGGNTLIGRLGIRSEDLVVGAAGVTIVNTTLTWFPIEPGSLIITDGTTIFTDDGVGGFTITGGAGTVNAPTNYTTGSINITFTNAVATISARYFVLVNDESVTMGLRRLDIEETVDYQLIGFDRVKSYLYSNTFQRFADISRYKNSGYEINWTGSNSDFFWSTNYQEAFWATNNTAGGHFYTVTAITKAANAVVTIGTHNFVVGDRVYFSNVLGMTQINNKIGTVTGIAATTITVNINSSAYGVYTSGGVAWAIEKSKASSGDGIRWYDSATTTGWVNFAPPLSNAAAPRILQGCLMMLPYKGRMLCLNTIEGTTFGGGKRYPQRIRYSQNGIPFVALSFPSASGITTSAGDAWYETPGKGGFIDAPTSEEIISAAFVKDVLIVFFERSTWRFDYTGNPVQPFVWNRINSELGSESTFSTVMFDKNATTIGGYAIAACNAADMVRIDDDIPERVYDFHNQFSGEKRVHGIRDYYNRHALWTYVDSTTNATYPNRELIFNYENESWSVLKNYYTTYGYYRRVDDLTWEGSTEPWSTYNIAWKQQTLQSLFPFIVGGNTHGFVFEVQDVDHTEFTSNNDTFYVIQNITAGPPSVLTVPNHGFLDGDHVYISDVSGATAINDVVYTVRNPATDTFELEDENGDPVAVAGYTYGGFVTVVDNFELETKKFNPFYGNGQKTKVGYVDFLVDNTTSGAITIELYHDEDEANAVVSQTIPLVDPKSAVSNKFWYRAYINVTAQQFSLRFKYTDVENGQIFDLDNNNQDVRLHGWILWATPAGRLTT